MLQLPLNQLTLLVNEINEQDEVKNTWYYYLHDFKLYPNNKEVPTLFIYQRNQRKDLLLLINIFTPSFVEEVIQLPKYNYQIWGNTIGNTYNKKGWESELELIKTINDKNLEDDKEKGSMFYFW
jgi:hypothetical protein